VIADEARDRRGLLRKQIRFQRDLSKLTHGDGFSV
jgi:hypothetical protein